MPLDTTGELLERRAMGLISKPYLGNADTISSEGGSLLPEDGESIEKGRERKGGFKRKNKDKDVEIDYQVSIYAKSPLPALGDEDSIEQMSNPAKGLVVKLYDQASGIPIYLD
jgi:hypothetical protein